MDIPRADGFIESGTTSVCWVECLHLALLHAGETRNTSTESTTVIIEDQIDGIRWSSLSSLNKSVVVHIPT